MSIGKLSLVAVVGVIAFSNVLWAQCPEPPFPAPTCPCSGTTVTDNTTTSAGIYCFNGGDDTITNLVVNDPSSVVYICADVVLTSTYINSGYIVIAPGVMVTYDNTWGSSWIDGGIINYGTLYLNSDFSLSPNGQLYNYGYLDGRGITVTGSSQVVIGPSATGTVLDQLDIQSNCGLCFNGGPSQMNVDTFATGGGLSSAICNDEGGTVCVDVATSEAIVNSPLTTDTSTTFFCVPDSATYNAIISSPYVGTANVGVCNCNQVFPLPMLTLYIDREGDQTLRLWWQWTAPPPSITAYVLYQTDHAHRFQPVATVTDTQYALPAPDHTTYFYVEALLHNGTHIRSNTVSYSPTLHHPIVLVNLGDDLALACYSAQCAFELFSYQGRLIASRTIRHGVYPLSALTTSLPASVYILKPANGVLRLLKLQ